MAKRPWIGTNWKMNKTFVEADEFARIVAGSDFADGAKAQLFAIPSFPAISRVAEALKETKVLVGAQNIHWEDAGQFTGEVSAVQARDAGARLALIGHSERREMFGETDETVALKAAAALRQGLVALVCIGDTRDEFDAGRTAEVLKRQTEIALSKIDWTAGEPTVVVAYEPVWSIGVRGTPAEPGFVEEQHGRIKQLFGSVVGRDLPLLYGGSVNPGNAVDLATREGIDGLFIGRSAWDANGLLAIARDVTDALA
ncbi:triosephosphate isomerase [Aureimonas endophytica]|uniref:Triosephosphate isomerase n=1 Tax=Aureimonas endophytica TaxID=2027858 RepID=A0A916ZCF2_9HYPH|nr:triose-phosphate isomerase [Aureimonas endophytica]GGD86911.1 triosephosphate isomerase [Aureimonas endophytica]